MSNSGYRSKSSRLVLTLLLSALVLGACRGRAQEKKEAEKLATLLDWKPGSAVAEIGAGDGGMTLAAAEHVGPDGRVYATELDAAKLAKLESLAAGHKDHNIVVVKAGETDANLPPECCDSIFMRRVYHHFTDPAKEDASLFASLKPGGLLAVIDFPPGKGPGNPAPVKGVPKNRGGHGMPKQLLIDELTAAGLHLITSPADWEGEDYCVLFRK